MSSYGIIQANCIEASCAIPRWERNGLNDGILVGCVHREVPPPEVSETWESRAPWVMKSKEARRCRAMSGFHCQRTCQPLPGQQWRTLLSYLDPFPSYEPPKRSYERSTGDCWKFIVTMQGEVLKMHNLYIWTLASQDLRGRCHLLRVKCHVLFFWKCSRGPPPCQEAEHIAVCREIGFTESLHAKLRWISLK